MRRLLAAATTVGILVSTAALADEIADRRAMMKQVNGSSVGTLVNMAKGEIPFDAEAARGAFIAMREGTEGFVALFPDGTQTGGDTVASPKIWEDKAGFEAAFADFQAELDTAIAAEPASVEELQPLLGAVGQKCTACHTEYRLQRN
jgi:cytochrome c556